ncbi:MAG: hypothetical protein IAE78_23850 [Myxococcus sp.]|nr:hypothetical protein [Myxococcus sp.]
MRVLQAAMVAAVLLSAGASSAQSHVELNLFGSSSTLSFGFGVHHHARRQVVVAPPPVYVQPQVYVQPPPVVYQQPPVVMAPPPMVQAAPVYVAPAPVVVQQPAPQVVTRTVTAPAPERPALIGLKYTPGLSGVFTSAPGAVGFTGARFSHSAGLEARLSRWFALRSDVELRNDSRSFDVIGAKVWLAGADWKVKPYLSASLSGTMADSRPNALSIGVVGAGGLDVFFGKHFFLEAEVRYRALPGACCTEVPQVTAVAGAGVAFF